MKCFALLLLGVPAAAVVNLRSVNATHKQPAGFGGVWQEMSLCTSSAKGNTLGIFVSKDSGATWEAVQGSGCTSSGEAYTNIAVCGHAEVTYFTTEQGCPSKSPSETMK